MADILNTWNETEEVIIYNRTEAPAEGLSHVPRNNTSDDKEKSWLLFSRVKSRDG